MSFSSDVKNELCHINLNRPCCNLAELAGIISFAGIIVSRQEQNVLRIRTENFSVAKRTGTLIKLIFGYDTEITEKVKKSGDSTYTIYIYKTGMFANIISKLGLLVNKIIKFNINPFIIQDECCRRSYLRGAFLGGGSVVSPTKSYHLEIETHYHGLSHDLKNLFEDEDLNVKIVMRKSGYVLYLKDSEMIADTLAMMGATSSMLELYNVKIEKDVKNNINRKVNCETANIFKTADAAARQIYAIKKLMKRPEVQIPDALRELAALRIEYPEASIKELGEMLTPPISKSGANHRLNKIIGMAQKYL